MSNSITDRMIRASRLDANLYEEVEADRSAIGQAMMVVVLSSIAAGIGAAQAGFGALVGGAVAALLGWYIWAFLTYLIGTKMLPAPTTEADVGQLLRTTGFSAAPGLLRAVGIVPIVGPFLAFAASLWMLVAMVIAVRQALDYESTGRAVAVCVVGWLVQIAITVVAMLLLVKLGFVEMPEGVAGG